MKNLGQIKVSGCQSTTIENWFSFFIAMTLAKCNTYLILMRLPIEVPTYIYDFHVGR